MSDSDLASCIFGLLNLPSILEGGTPRYNEFSSHPNTAKFLWESDRPQSVSYSPLKFQHHSQLRVLSQILQLLVIQLWVWIWCHHCFVCSPLLQDSSPWGDSYFYLFHHHVISDTPFTISLGSFTTCNMWHIPLIFVPPFTFFYPHFSFNSSCIFHFMSMCLRRKYNFLGDNGVVRMSAQFKALWMNLKETMPAATASLTLWYARALCLSFRVLLGEIVLTTMLWLSPYMMVGAWIATPSILSWNLSSMLSSVATLAATNSDPEVKVSTVFCLLLY